MNELIVTDHGLVRACQRLFGVTLLGKGDAGKVKDNQNVTNRAHDFLKKSVVLPQSKFIKGTIYRTYIEGFDGHRAVMVVDENDATVHKLLTIKEIRK